MNLSKKNIQKTIQKLEKVKNRTYKNFLLVTEDLMEITYQTLVDIFKNNNLSNHIGSLNKELINNGLGFRIWTNDWIVIFNEYGTGIKGIGTHPNPNNYEYNIKTEFKDEFGRWTYYNDDVGQYVTTNGMPAKHMFNDVENLLNECAKEFYSSAINLALDDKQYQTFRTSLKR